MPDYSKYPCDTLECMLRIQEPAQLRNQLMSCLSHIVRSKRSIESLQLWQRRHLYLLEQAGRVPNWSCTLMLYDGKVVIVDRQALAELLKVDSNELRSLTGHINFVLRLVTRCMSVLDFENQAGPPAN